MINQPRPTQRRTLNTLDDEESLTTDIIKLAVRFGRYGYRRITALLRDRGWQVKLALAKKVNEKIKEMKKQKKERKKAAKARS